MDDNVGAHPASSWSLVSGLCQQMGIQASTGRLSPGSVTQFCLVCDSVSSSGPQLTALSVLKLQKELCCLSSMLQLLAW